MLKYIQAVFLAMNFIAALGQMPDYIFKSGYEGSSTLDQYTLNGSSSINHADISGIDGCLLYTSPSPRDA